MNVGSPEEEIKAEVNQHLLELEKIFLKYDQRRPMNLTLIASHILPDNRQVIYLFSGHKLIDVIPVLLGTIEIIKEGQGQ